MAAVGLTTARPSSRLAVGALLTGLVIGAVVATGVTIALTNDPESGVEIGETFEGKVVSYFPPPGPEPNVICFDREHNCGGVVLLDDDQAIKVGQKVTATEIWLSADDGSGALHFYIHPTEPSE